jgi:glycosyltransferase involved in cell wall biosynthesis
MLHSGWGQHLAQIAQRLPQALVRPIHYGGPVEVPSWLQDITLPPKWVRNLNEAAVVVVPCRWNRDAFLRCGVKRPIRVVPLGCDNIRRAFMNMEGPTVFGCAGRPQHGVVRKGVHQVIAAFLKAFPGNKDVRLRIKTMADEKWDIPEDERIIKDTGFFPDPKLYNWYGSLTCFVSAARGEGWGLMQHQAMSAARPVLASIYGGLKEFMNNDNSYACDYDEVKADYVGGGKWCQPRMEHMIDLMRYVHQSRDEAQRRGREAARSVQEFTWNNSCERLFKTLNEFGL